MRDPTIPPRILPILPVPKVRNIKPATEYPAARPPRPY
jgi:hypothetical protein